MTKKLIVSDVHCHAWSQFSSVDPATGWNSRLTIICKELLRAAAELKAAGGETMIVAGDLFHVRGSIDPEVFNPVHSIFQEILALGIEVIALPGNHDLKGKETTEIGNAIQTLGALDKFTVVTKTTVFETRDLIVIPWCATPDKLRAEVNAIREVWDCSNFDLIIHAGINGVLAGMPDHGLDAEEVASWGFRRVFSGHYHNFKSMCDGAVYSIGATTHQTWGDIGSKAGFLLFDEEDVTWRASNAPSFVEIDADTPEEEIPLVVDGNYVRIRGLKLTDSEINQMRKELLEMGAKGVRFDIAREVVSARLMSKPTKALSLDQSVDKYIEESEFEHKPEIQALCASLLEEARSVSA